MIQIHHKRAQNFVGIFGAVYRLRRFALGIVSPAAYFQRGNDRDSFGFTDAFKF